MVAVKYDDLALAFDFVSSAAPMEHSAYISMDTGRIYWVSDLMPMEEEELPDDLETSDRYIEIPHKNELDLGRDLALRFTAKELPERHDEVRAYFRSRGAYARFKQLLESEGYLERWYRFEEESAEKALRSWCADNEIQVVDNDERSSA